MITKPLSLLAVCILMLSQTVLAQEIVRPFDPAFAADQEKITSRSIEFEGQQFSKIGQWLIAKDQVETKRLEKDQAKESLDRARELYNKGVATETELRQEEYNFDSAKRALEISLTEMQLQEAYGKKFKLLLLDEGNSQQDLRKQVAESMKVIHLKTTQILSSQLSSAQAGVNYWTYRVDMDRKRYEKRLIRKSQLERSELILKMSQDQLRTVQFKISTNELAIEGVNKTLERLQ